MNDALTKNPSSSTANTPKEILLKEVGVPLYKYNPIEGASWKSWDKKTKIDELKKAQRKYIRDYSGKKSTEEINKKMKWYGEQIVKVNQE